MRILQVTSHLNVGGVSRYVLSLSKALVQRGHRLTIASDGGQLESEATADGLTHWRLPLHTSVEFSPAVFSASQALARRLANDPVELVHAHTRVGQVVAARLSRRFRIPYVTTWHGFFKPNLGRRLWPCTGDVAIAISEPVRQHLLETFHVPADRIALIPNGIDLRRYETPIDPAAPQRLRAQLQLAPEGPIVGTVARLVPSKGVDRLIRCFPKIRMSIPSARLLLVGDGPERVRLERLANANGMKNAVAFAGALADTRAALALMDVFVFLPAEQEGFGLALLEAMASGRPIVSLRRGGGAPWVLEQSGVGLVVEPDDAAALATAIIRLLHDRAQAAQEAAKARAVVEERYSLDRMVDQVEILYDNLTRR